MPIYRLEDQGLTLRLFHSPVAVHHLLQVPKGCSVPPLDLKALHYYGCGWLVQLTDNKWVDAHGPLPSQWRPQPKLLGPARSP